jgi:tetratricopeptide (TPR) repeat protein
MVDTTGMRVAVALALGLVASCLALADEPAQDGQPPETLPVPRTAPAAPKTTPRPLPRLDDCFPRPHHPLKEALEKLTKERDALATAHAAAARDFDDGLAINTTANAMLRLRVKQLLAQLSQQRAAAQKSPAPPTVQLTQPTPQPPSPKSDKLPIPPPTLLPREPKAAPAGLPKVVDPLAVAHALFRAGSNDAALQAFRLINLKGMRAEQRAPIQYLMASCLRRLGKLDEALAFYREVANSKGDEQVAACAQWQIANLRWQRDTLDLLAAMKQRRLALEK